MKQTQFRVYLDNASITVTGTVAITFPTTAVARTQAFNNTVAIPNNTDTVVLAANTNRKSVQIQNLSGSTMYWSIGGAASTGTQQLPTGQAIQITIDALGGIETGDIHLFQNSGGSLNVIAYEAN